MFTGHVRRLLMAINQQKVSCYGFTVTGGDASDVELKGMKRSRILKLK
jgi:hypothetical protein